MDYRNAYSIKRNGYKFFVEKSYRNDGEYEIYMYNPMACVIHRAAYWKMFGLSLPTFDSWIKGVKFLRENVEELY